MAAEAGARAVEIPDHEAMAERLRSARERILGVAHRTPVATSRTLNERLGATVFFKCENLQRVGAFKFRGAYNTISRLPEEARRRGVVAYSSGNHAQAVALASQLLGIPATIVMPSGASPVKLAATRGYGAEVLHHDDHGMEREGLAAKLSAERGLALIPPFEHLEIVAGAGTATAELIEETGPLDLLLVPVGGGGLISGSSLAVRMMSPECRVIGVEPELGDDGVRSFRSGARERVDASGTIADGARTPQLGELTFALIRRYVSDMTSVPDAELIHAMRFVMERMKLMVEPTGVLGLAALLAGRVEARGKRVGVIISGGNVDPLQAQRWFAGAAAEVQPTTPPS